MQAHVAGQAVVSLVYCTNDMEAACTAVVDMHASTRQFLYRCCLTSPTASSAQPQCRVTPPPPCPERHQSISLSTAIFLAGSTGIIIPSAELLLGIL